MARVMECVVMPTPAVCDHPVKDSGTVNVSLVGKETGKHAEVGDKRPSCAKASPSVCY